MGRTKGGSNSKLHAFCDGHGRPVFLLLAEGQVSDDEGVAILRHLLPDNSIVLADGGYDVTWLRESLKAKGMKVCIPPRKTGNETIPFGKTLYKRCAYTFFQPSASLSLESSISINESCP